MVRVIVRVSVNTAFLVSLCVFCLCGVLWNDVDMVQGGVKVGRIKELPSGGANSFWQFQMVK